MDRRFVSGLLVGLVIAATGPAVGAQAVARIDRASLVIPVQMTIAPRLLLVSAGPAQVVGKTADGVEIELPFRVAANVSWSVSIGLPQSAEGATGAAVLTDRGAWRPLVRGIDVRVIGRRDPSEPSIIRLRVRLPSSAKPGLAETLRVSIGPAEGSSAE